MEIGLFQKQTMKLFMTAELRNAISLLQLSTFDLAQFIQEQSLENPLLELEEKQYTISFEERYKSINKANFSTENEESVNPFEFIPNEEQGMHEKLLDQIKWLPINEKERDILGYLILNLDDNGYLIMNNAEIAAALLITEAEVEKYIQMLQQLEPIGVGSRDLKECLYIQAQKQYPNEPLLACVINNYLELLSDNKWKEIAKELKISLQEVKQISEYIQTLEPRPCAKISNTATKYLFPDITVEKTGEEFIISLNDKYIPTVKVNEDYMSLLKNKNTASAFLHDNYQKYLWLMKSIEQRRETILKITTFIVSKQRSFLEKGFTSLHAMTLKEVADAIDMHESTVSRAVSNKVIQTPIGAFEMKRLFSSKLTNNDGSNTSSAKVKVLLQQVIDEENKKKPYSDQKLTDYFKKHHGITISRRTVAKYREELNILSSAKRKVIV